MKKPIVPLIALATSMALSGCPTAVGTTEPPGTTEEAAPSQDDPTASCHPELLPLPRPDEDV